VPQLGFYEAEKQRLVSVTSLLDYVFGIADELDQWSLKQAVLAVQKASKTQKLTQEQAKQIGLAERSRLLDKSRIRGTQVHQAIQNHHNGLSYELTDDDAAYFAAYFNWAKEHTIEPILQEFRVNNFQYGYAGRLDFYGKLDNQLVLLDFKTSNFPRWTYGLQLAMYRKCLEDAGYKVDATYVVHIKPKKRGGDARAELIEFKYPFEAVKWAVGLFNLKLAFDPFVKWYERTDEEAIKKELDTMSSSESVPESDAQGQQQETQDISPSIPAIELGPLVESPQYAYLNRGETPSLSQALSESSIDALIDSIHTVTPQESPYPIVSGRITATQLDSQPVGVIRFAGAATPQILQDPFEHLLETGTLERQIADWDSELNIRRKPRPKSVSRET